MSLHADHARIRRDAEALAGRPEDLVQRASVYLHLYRHSGGNHGFPLLAAHGALWGAGHFRRGHLMGRVLSAGLRREERELRRGMVETFATAFKDINRRVCVETFTAYHLTRLHGGDPDLETYIPASLIAALNRCHAANVEGRSLGTKERRDLFKAFFLWEQEAIVGPSIDAAVADFDWPLMRALSMRPPIGFSYFGRFRWLLFRAFHDMDERILRGLQAFELAEARGWDAVEARLSRYGLMPVDVLREPERNFWDLAQKFGAGGYCATVQ